MNETAEFIGTRSECPACGSSRGFAKKTDGSGFCHSCNQFLQPDGEAHEVVPVADFLARNDSAPGLIPQEQIQYGDLTARGIRLEICKDYSYGTTKHNGQAAQVAQYRDPSGRVVLQKLRLADKTFRWLSAGNEADRAKTLFGLDQFDASTFKAGITSRIIITEGELDALAARQSVGKWPVVSLPDGASSARKYLQKSLEALLKFDEVILAFDMDKSGQKAVEECIDLFPAGTVRIAKLSQKDACEVLQLDGQTSLRDQLWGAPAYSPEWAVQGDAILEQIKLEAVEPGISFPWEGLNVALAGMRPKQLTVLAAGTSSGKSSVCRHLALHAAQQGWKVGYVALEESVRESALGIYGIELRQHLTLTQDEELPWEELKGVQEALGDKFVFTKAWGTQDQNELLGRLRYLVKGCDARVIFLDHLSIAVESGDDERKAVDRLMTALRTFVEETGVAMYVVSHLRRTPGQRAAEEGGQVSSSHLRSSHGIAQLADSIIAVERDQQAEDMNLRMTSCIRVLKNRALGRLGPVAWLKFDPDTHTLSEVPEPTEATDFGPLQ